MVNFGLLDWCVVLVLSLYVDVGCVCRGGSVLVGCLSGVVNCCEVCGVSFVI